MNLGVLMGDVSAGPLSSDFVCQCPEGFMGKLCEIGEWRGRVSMRDEDLPGEILPAKRSKKEEQSVV